MSFINTIKNFFISPNKQFEEYKKGNLKLWNNWGIIIVLAAILGLVKMNEVVDVSKLSEIDPEKAQTLLEHANRIARPEISIPILIVTYTAIIFIAAAIYYVLVKALSKDIVVNYLTVVALYSFVYGISIIGEIVAKVTSVDLLAIPFQVLFYTVLTLGVKRIFSVDVKKFAAVAVVMFLLTNINMFIPSIALNF